MTGQVLDARLGTILAGHRIDGVLGRGGMGVVYRATQLRLDRQVALKLLIPELANDTGFRQRFETECRLAAAIDHPHVIPLYEAGETEDGLLFLTMKLVDGVDFRAHLRRQAPLNPKETSTVLTQVADALDEAHRRDLVHRDVKPANILISADSRGQTHCYLSDFGLTRRISSDSGITVSGQFVGTLHYVAPEQIQGQPLDGRADVYALGCVLFECLSGVPPFTREADVALIWAHMQEPPPSLTAIRPDVPPGVDGVIAKALAKAPDDRFGTCKAMLETFDLAMRGDDVSDRTKVAARPATERPPGRQRRAVATLAATASVLLVVAALAVVLTGALSTGLDSPSSPAAETQAQSKSSAAPPECSSDAAERELRQVGDLEKPTFSGVGSIVCRDFTRDGVDDMAFIRNSTGSAGPVGWGIFVATDGKWRRALWKPDDSRIGLKPVDDDLQRVEPVYLEGDPLCCATGGWDIEQWHWSGRTFTISRTFRDPDEAPPGGFGYGTGAGG